MHASLRAHFERELAHYRQCWRERRRADAWTHLERAHVLSQAHAGAHFAVHARMFVFACRNGDAAEAWGQIPRLLLAIPGSLTGKAPRGNTGGAKVGIFTPMPIPDDLQRILSESSRAS